MFSYRFYFLNHSGHINHVEVLKAQGDFAAREIAAEAAKDTRWELWDEARLVARSEDYQQRA